MAHLEGRFTQHHQLPLAQLRFTSTIPGIPVQPPHTHAPVYQVSDPDFTAPSLVITIQLLEVLLSVNYPSPQHRPPTRDISSSPSDTSTSTIAYLPAAHHYRPEIQPRPHVRQRTFHTYFALTARPRKRPHASSAEPPSQDLRL